MDKANSAIGQVPRPVMQRIIRNASIKPHVAIVGAGFAGLRCADVLLKSGAKVTIYEARDRVGGRVHQETLNGRLMDMGPNWIHGTKHNPICTLASKTETILHDFDGRITIYNSDGKPFPPEESLHIFKKTWVIIEKAFRYSEENKDNIEPSKSLYDFFKEQVQFESDPGVRSLILQMSHEWGAFVGDAVDTQSLRFFFLESTIEGETLFVADTYRKILHEVSRPAISGAEILLNTEVTSITSTPDPSSKPITLTTTSQRATYDEVVVTSPLGYLQHHKSTLFPQPSLLSPRLSSAISNLHYGGLEKVYVTFPTAWWAPPSPTSTGSTTSSTSPSSYPPQFLHFFSRDPSDPRHALELASLSLPLPPSTAQPTLLFYIHPPLSTQLVSRLSPHAPSSPSYAAVLSEFTSPYISALPHHSPTSPSCKPLGFLATTWQADRLAGYGSYTNFQVGLEAGDEDIRVLRESEGTGRERGVWFAGEHTSPLEGLGTTTGAYWAGENVARRVMGEWGVQVPEGMVGERPGDMMMGRDPVPHRD